MTPEQKKEFLMFVPEDDGSAMDWVDNQLDERYVQGFNDGANQQYKLAYQQGLKDGLQKSQEVLDEMMAKAREDERDRIAALCYQLECDGEKMYKLIYENHDH